MILNNCTTCGRKPEIGYTKITGFSAWCSCGKTVFSDFGIWPSAEVAADMWNRANQKEEEVRRDYLNYLADKAAKDGLMPTFNEQGELEFNRMIKVVTNPHLFFGLRRCRKELTEFYKKRLEPGVKV